MNEKAYNTELLNGAFACWSAASWRLAQRTRLKRYTYGDQWGDLVRDAAGNTVREGDAIAAAGRKPLTNNLIRRLVKTIVGRYRSLRPEWRKDFPADIDAANQLSELDARMLEEFLISGMAVQRVAHETRRGVTDLYVDNVSPARFFCNAFTDPRGTDIEMAGMMHDMSLAEVLSRFGGRDRRRMDALRRLFAATDAAAFPVAHESTDFFVAPQGRCRVFELWTLEAIETSRRNIADISFAWRCRWLAPDGFTLASYFSPWPHRSHPFVVKFYPLTDGEVHPFVEDVLDQQRFINRLIVLIDKVMGASAKGVLLFPVDQLPRGFSWEDVAARWSATDSIIPITGRSPVIPQQINTPTGDSGAYRLLDIEMKLFNEASGVSDALLGNDSGGNGGQALYESRVRNSTIALQDTFESFNAFITARDSKIKTLIG